MVFFIFRPIYIWARLVSVVARCAQPTGNIPAPANKSVFLYLTTACQEHPEILRKFGPDDLTGIAIALHPARQALDQIEKWTRLNELIFFNPIFKSLPAQN